MTVLLLTIGVVIGVVEEEVELLTIGVLLGAVVVVELSTIGTGVDGTGATEEEVVPFSEAGAGAEEAGAGAEEAGNTEEDRTAEEDEAGTKELLET